jgi:hypothetical protein
VGQCGRCIHFTYVYCASLQLSTPHIQVRSWPSYWLLWLTVFVLLFSPSRWPPGWYYLEIGGDCLLRNAFLSVSGQQLEGMYYHSYCPVLCSSITSFRMLHTSQKTYAPQRSNRKKCHTFCRARRQHFYTRFPCAQPAGIVQVFTRRTHQLHHKTKKCGNGFPVWIRKHCRSHSFCRA